jgi:hypothetical protein
MKTSLFSFMLLIALLNPALADAAQTGGHWQLLGEQEVDFKNDHDRIDVKRSAGPLRQLRIEVRNGPIEIRDMVVTFADGKTFKPKVKGRFREGSGSQVIYLPEKERSIDAVEFVYHSTSRSLGKGRVLLYAR